ncbi:hypothetical protein [Pontibacter sp. SGAir0037]|uniref:hypothetical protein n=1 Tax=Pontibacter sp. SGAir0037 TaxID=2571030 RepID=UPI0010CCE169|nr:hypothetical protein [Pontibacter sp. SGAir0037]QCR23352.1 hypothetical protein C1N53_14060 [Pontibacter sp. SGAir0037]
MKMLFVFAAYLFGFGLVCNETVRTSHVQPAAADEAVAIDVEVPVMTVMLDTVVVSASASHVTTGAVAGNLK